MLAFTVQFSRYGRNRAYQASHPGPRSARPFESPALRKAAASSGPNSVLGSPTSVRSSFGTLPEEAPTDRRTVRRTTE